MWRCECGISDMNYICVTDMHSFIHLTDFTIAHPSLLINYIPNAPNRTYPGFITEIAFYLHLSIAPYCSVFGTTKHITNAKEKCVRRNAALTTTRDICNDHINTTPCESRSFHVRFNCAAPRIARCAHSIQPSLA